MVIDERRGTKREKYHFTPDDETIGLDTKSVENFLSRNSKRFLDSFLLSLCFVLFLCSDYMQVPLKLSPSIKSIDNKIADI